MSKYCCKRETFGKSRSVSDVENVLRLESDSVVESYYWRFREGNYPAVDWKNGDNGVVGWKGIEKMFAAFLKSMIVFGFGGC